MIATNRSASNVQGMRPLPPPVPIRNPLTLALFWASKTDPRLAAVCSRFAQATQGALGFFVLISASMAFLAAFCTLSTVSVVSGSSIRWIALGYAAFILACDREIVGSLDRTAAVVRPVLALLISAILTIPLELAIFQPRVDQELERQYRYDNKHQIEGLHSALAKLDVRRSDLERSITDLQGQEREWAGILDSEAVGRPGTGRTGVQGIGPAFRNAQAQQESVRERIREVRRDLERLDRSLPAERQRLEAQFRQEEIRTTKDFASRYEALGKVIHSSDALYTLSWILWAALAAIEMMGAVLKLFSPGNDYLHLVKAEIRENCARIDELSDRNYRLAMENPEIPRLSVAEKFTIVRYTPIPPSTPFERRHETGS